MKMNADLDHSIHLLHNRAFVVGQPDYQWLSIAASASVDQLKLRLHAGCWILLVRTLHRERFSPMAFIRSSCSTLCLSHVLERPQSPPRLRLCTIN